MEVFKTVEALQKQLSKVKSSTKIGFVPTMGALHNGHLSIVKKAKTENNLVVVSIFVNPTQFDKKEDLLKYPKTIKNDLQLLENINCDIVFIPSVEELYSDKIEAASFDFEGLDKVMEGAFRTGHFDGVGTIVKKLFEIVKPNNAYFGEKDYQQLQIIKKMTANQKLPVNIVSCKIFREEDGLAMSSRNVRLSSAQRDAAPLIYKSLLKSKKLFPEKSIKEIKKQIILDFESEEFLTLEYFEIANSETLTSLENKEETVKYRAFIAAFAGAVRLIDNIALN